MSAENTEARHAAAVQIFGEATSDLEFVFQNSAQSRMTNWCSTGTALRQATLSYIAELEQSLLRLTGLALATHDTAARACFREEMDRVLTTRISC